MPDYFRIVVTSDLALAGWLSVPIMEYSPRKMLRVSQWNCA